MYQTQWKQQYACLSTLTKWKRNRKTNVTLTHSVCVRECCLRWFSLFSLFGNFSHSVFYIYVVRFARNLLFFFSFFCVLVCLFLNEMRKTIDVQCFILPFLECMAEMLLRILKIFHTTQKDGESMHIHIVLCLPVAGKHIRFAGIHFVLCFLCASTFLTPGILMLWDI